MRIALLMPGFSRDVDDWAIPALQALACRLARRHDVHVFSLRYPGAGRYEFCGLTHHATGGGTRFGAASLAVWKKTLRALIAEHGRAPFDVFHAFWIDEPGLVAIVARVLLRRPVVASSAGGEMVYFPDLAYGTWGSFLRRLLVQLVLRSATVVTAGSAYQRALCVARGAPAGRVSLAPLGVDVHQFQPGEIPAWECPTIVQSASLTPVKNQTMLLRILAAVRDEVPAVRLLLAGEGPQEPALREVADRLEVSGLVEWAGQIRYPRMPAIYRQGHLFLQTSRHESQGMSVLEGMACGLPALGTPVGVMPEVAARPAVRDVSSLVRQVVELLSDRVAYERCRQEARETVVEEYRLEAAVARFEAVYRSLVSGV